MTPLNLALAAPRPAHAALDGLVFLPRSIDKVRATLPGGDSGAYVIPGLTQAMLDTLGVPLAEFSRAVSAAGDDREVAEYLRTRATQTQYDAWNEALAAREPRNGNRAEALSVYPWLKDRPDLILVLDVLEEDDRQLFAAKP